MSKDSILLVDDDPVTIRLVARMLGSLADLRFATSGEDALRLARQLAPDLMLLDTEMPGMSGFDVCRTLKADPELAGIAVIFITSHSEPAFEIAGFAAGAADFIAKPVSEPLLRARVMTQLRVKQLTDDLRRAALIDSLTGVANRRAFDEALVREWRDTVRSGDPLALLLIDVDLFKLFNDRYGHPAGDGCLRSVAQSLKGTTRRSADLVARYGGEEFVILLPRTTRAGAAHMAWSFNNAVESLDIAHLDSLPTGLLTVSTGVGCYDRESRCWMPPSSDSRSAQGSEDRCSQSGLVQAADKALYSAKQSGRAKVMLLDIADVDAPQLARDIMSSPILAPSRV
jgi:diguanylate cyclase (GGDEF)-like protein